MRVTKRTKTGDIVPLLNTKERFEEFMDKIPEVPLKKRLISMTIGEFIEAASEEYAETILKEKRALKAFGRLKSYRRQMREIEDFVEKNRVKLSAEEQQAQAGVTFPDYKQQMLLDTATFLHLNSLDAAERIPLSNWLIIHLKQTADAKFERNLHKVYEAKSKRK